MTDKQKELTKYLRLVLNEIYIEIQKDEEFEERFSSTMEAGLVKDIIFQIEMLHRRVG